MTRVSGGPATAGQATPPSPLLSQVMMDAAFDLSPDGILVVDDQGERLSYNRRYRDMWRLTDETLRDHPPYVVCLQLAPLLVDPEGFSRRAREIIEAPAVSSYDLLHLRDGRTLERHSTPLRLDGEVRGRVWFFREITERMKSAADQSLLAAIIESSPDAIASVDLEGRVTTWNPGAERILGFTAEDMVGQAPLIRSPDGGGGDEFLEVMDQIRRGTDLGSLDTLRLRKDGTPVHLSLNYSTVKNQAGEPIGGVYIARDVTERKQAEADQALLAAIVESSPDGICSLDLEGRITSWNRGAERITGFAAAEVIGRPAGLESPDGVIGARLSDILERIGRGAEGEVFEITRLRKDRSVVEIAVRYSSVRDRSGSVVGGAMIFHDITDRKRAEAELIRMARFDDLTGLPNRTSFAGALRVALERRRADAGTLAVLALDVDHFRYINDTLGYLAGDRLLAALARRISAAVDDASVVARLGGNTFAVLVDDLASGADIERTAARLLETIGEPVLIDGAPLRVGASLGIASSDGAAADAATLLARAEIALHRAKIDNPGAFLSYTQAMDEAVHRVMQLGGVLREAMAAGRFRLVYQPQVDGETGAIIGAEALVRLDHPERSAVSPGDFMPIAERLGLAPGVGRWVMGEACRQIRCWLGAGLSPPVIAINLSATQFNTPGELERDLDDAIARNGLTPRRLDLELTETALMQSAVGQNDALRRLRARGFRLSIDDFGAGYSSLDYLRRFPVDRIKIDKAFVKDLDSTRGAEAIIKSVIALAGQLGASILAEGVETADQRDRLRRWNCREMQGHYFSRPLDAAAFTALLEAGRPLPLSQEESRSPS